MDTKEKTGSPGRPTPGVLLYRSLTVLLMSAVPVYGVLALAWDSVRLMLLFLGEAAIVLGTDALKTIFRKQGKKIPDAFVIELVFILFFGFFALLVYGPYDSLEQLILDRLEMIWNLIEGELAGPLLVILAVRGVRLTTDPARKRFRGNAGSGGLALEGGPWAILLFLAVTASPLVAGDGPNPTGGLMVIIGLRTAGELIMVWSPLIAFAGSNKKLPQRR